MYRLSGDDDLNNRNYDDAINFYTSAINEDPNYGVALYNRGIAKWRMRLVQRPRKAVRLR